MDNVLVLMSTYNGEKYLKTQLDSILAQQGVNVQILVRDDGSSDGTLEILQDYAAQGKLTYYTGPNLKPAQSFMDLIYNAPQADFYAFADQDDYWLPEKLICAVNKLKHPAYSQHACLYCGKTLLTDKDLKPLPVKSVLSKSTAFNRAVLYSNVTGCTVVFNRKLLALAWQYKPGFLIMHDAWVHKLCLAVGGKVFHDEQPYVYYRQHIANACGGERTFFKRLKKFFGRFIYKNQIHSRMLSELLKGYGADMLPENRRICEKVLAYKKGFKYKWRLLTDTSLRTGDKQMDLSFILNILLGRF